MGVVWKAIKWVAFGALALLVLLIALIYHTDPHTRHGRH